MKTKYDIDEVVAIKAVVESIDIRKNGCIIYKLKPIGRNDRIWLDEENVHKYKFDREDTFYDE